MTVGEAIMNHALAVYPDSDLQAASGAVVVQRNSFFGRTLTACVRDYLEMRKRNNGGVSCPASLDEIFDALKEGGYDLQTISAKGPMEQKRGVSISLAKNSATFVRLPTPTADLLTTKKTRRLSGRKLEVSTACIRRLPVRCKESLWETKGLAMIVMRNDWPGPGWVRYYPTFLVNSSAGQPVQTTETFWIRCAAH